MEIKEKAGVGAIFEAELYRRGKLVEDPPEKKKKVFLIRKIPGGIITYELIPKEDK